MNDIKESTPEKKMKFDACETFEMKSDGKIFELKISLNECLIFFKVEEKNTSMKEEFNIYLSLYELKKIDALFSMFKDLKGVLESLKKLFKKNNLSIIKEENLVKIKIINPVNDEEFFLNIPKKEKELKNEMNSIIPYINSLNDKIKLLENKVDNLENKLNEIYIYKNELEQIKKESKKEMEKESGKECEKECEKEKENERKKNYEINKSDILNKNEVDLLLSWLEKKNPLNIKLLLDSKIDGDLIETFYKKCSEKFPTIVLVKTTKGRRFGGYSSIPWRNSDSGSFDEDKNNFIFSLDKKQKYTIKKPRKAIQTSSNYFGFGAGSDFLIYDKCTSNTNSYNNNSGTYNTTETYELNGERNYTVSSYEVYEIEY